MSYRIIARRGATALLGVLLPFASAMAQTAIQVPEVHVETAPDGWPGEASIAGPELDAKRVGTSDPADLLKAAPGVSLYTNGGISKLPALNGLADDRVNVRVDGLTSLQACSNHMNSPLSYVDPAQIEVIQVLPGVTPVSRGGDSIAGTVIVERRAPVFASAGEKFHTEGSISGQYRSNNNAVSGSTSVTGATQNASATYDGSFTRARNYHDGNGNIVPSTKYSVRNHSLGVAGRTGADDLFEIRGGQQYIPYQAFPNQPMDMTYNRQSFVNGHYKKEFEWGTLDAKTQWQDIGHEMDMLSDKGGRMPMSTKARKLGYTLSAEIELSAANTLRIGNELDYSKLNDWWPPVGAGMMSPNTFISINNGRRNRLGTYAELETKQDAHWTTLFGVRNDTVWMDTGDVQGYNGMYAADAAGFNALDHAKTDVNLDLTALARYSPDHTEHYAFGYGRKTRSPNLYERYTWSRGSMASSMINWFGDLNGYVGDIDLDPEVAHTVSASAEWSDKTKKDWTVSLSPHVSYVEDIIDVDRIGTNMGGRARLRFANHDAVLYGLDLSGRKALARSAAWGEVDLVGTAAWLRGRRTDGGDLYHIMPLHGTAALEHRIGQWTSAIETELVATKVFEDERRLEPRTSGYGLVHLRASYQVLEDVRLDLAVQNLFDKQYAEPLGGVSDATSQPLAAPGRSVNAGLSVKF